MSTGKEKIKVKNPVVEMDGDEVRTAPHDVIVWIGSRS
jgi:hypothetical protein